MSTGTSGAGSTLLVLWSDAATGCVVAEQDAQWRVLTVADNQVDAFFTITNAGDERTGSVVLDDRVARYGWAGGRMLDLTATPLERRWPALPQAFRAGFDAAVTTPLDDPWTFVFRGPDCLRLHPVDGTVAELGTITARFPGLPTAFTSGIDAALPGPNTNQVYFFRDDTCVLYDTRALAVVETGHIATMWTHLQTQAPTFTNGISAATYDPANDQFHFFLGDQYTTGTLATHTVTTNAATIDDTSWPGLVRALSMGFLYLTTVRIPLTQNPTYVVDLEGQEAVHGITHLMPLGFGATTSSPDGRFVYLRLAFGLLCADTATRAVVAEFPESDKGGLSSSIAFSEDGERTYFVSLEARGLDPYLEVVRTGTFDSMSRIPLPGHGRQGHGLNVGYTLVAVGPGEDRVYVGIDTARDRSVVLEIDMFRQNISWEFTYDDNTGRIRDLALSPDGSVLHVTHVNQTLAIDRRNGEILQRGIIPPCRHLQFSPSGEELYCTPRGDAETGLLVADPETHKILHTIPLRADGSLGRPTEVAFDHDGTRAYVDERVDRAIVIVDVASHRRVGSFELPAFEDPHVSTFGLAYTPQ